MLDETSTRKNETRAAFEFPFSKVSLVIPFAVVLVFAVVVVFLALAAMFIYR